MSEAVQVAGGAGGETVAAGRRGRPLGDRVDGSAGEVFWNLPNTITLFRIAAVPVLLFIPWAQGEVGSQIMAWCYIVVAVSDLLDGWLARRGSQVTAVGKLLDPLADKLLVSTALIMLLACGRLGVWDAPMVVVIVGREFAVTGLRGMASYQGQIVSAGVLGKIKTLLQNFAIGALLFHYETIGLDAHRLGWWCLVLATALTLWSGVHYFRDYMRLGNGKNLDRQGLDAERPT